MALLLVDNQDSFTYNLVHAFEVLGARVEVVSSQGIGIEDCLSRFPERVVISPGPGTPSNAGISKALIQACAGKAPVLGVCLGHQALAEAYGGRIIPARRPIHGFLSKVFHNGQGLFADIPSPFLAARYHSLVVERASLPGCLEVTAETQEGEIMGLRHRDFPLEGVQFHPEAVLTEHGNHILNNFLNKRNTNETQKYPLLIDRGPVPACLIR